MVIKTLRVASVFFKNIYKNYDFAFLPSEKIYTKYKLILYEISSVICHYLLHLQRVVFELDALKKYSNPNLFYSFVSNMHGI